MACQSRMCEGAPAGCPERPPGSQPAFAWGDIALGSIPVHPITERPSLFPGSYTRFPIGSPCSLLSGLSTGGKRAYHVPCHYPHRLGPAFPPMVQRPRWMRSYHPCLPICLLAQASEFALFSLFGLSYVTAFIGDLHPLALLCHPGSRPYETNGRKSRLTSSPADPFRIEVTLSSRLQTLPLPVAPARLGYRWRYIGWRHLLSDAPQLLTRHRVAPPPHI